LRYILELSGDEISIMEAALSAWLEGQDPTIDAMISDPNIESAELLLELTADLDTDMNTSANLLWKLKEVMKNDI